MRLTINLTARLILLLSLFVVLHIQSAVAQTKNWVGTWSCSPYAAEKHTPPEPFIASNTLRQVVRVSIGGETLRIKFSNKTCATPVTMKKVNIAVSKGESKIDPSTITELTFNGYQSVTMNPYSELHSDPFKFNLDTSMRIAITIFYGEAATSPDMTFHYGSRTDSYILKGDHSTSDTFAGATVVERWYHINTIDVLADETAGCVGILGNSITDGYGLHGGLQNRWTDIFSQKLLVNKRTQNIGVLNMGIGATLVSGPGPTTGVSRYKDDLLTQSGIRWIIIFYGTNDIGAGKSASTIIKAYQTIIDDAHAMGIKVYGATITPFKGSGYFSEAHENVRNEVNKWIRTPGNFDACIDFDKTIRDPNDIEKMTEKFSKDWLHPNESGLAVLGNSVDLNLFTDKE